MLRLTRAVNRSDENSRGEEEIIVDQDLQGEQGGGMRKTRSADDSVVLPKKVQHSRSVMVAKETNDELKYRRYNFRDLDDIDSSRKLRCTVCNISLLSHVFDGEEIHRHPCLKVLICKKCLDFYDDGNFLSDEHGSDNFCRWCGQGGTLYCCKECNCAFCKKCIHQNLGRNILADIIESKQWKCFVCDVRPLWELRAICKLTKDMKRLSNLKCSQKENPFTGNQRRRRQPNRWQKRSDHKSSTDDRFSRTDNSELKKNKSKEDMVSKMKEIEEEKKNTENENAAEQHSQGQNDFSLQEDMVSKMKEIEEEKKRENENVAEESSPGQNDFSLQEDMVSKMKEIEEEKKRENENVAEESSPGQNDFSLQEDMVSKMKEIEEEKKNTVNENAAVQHSQGQNDFSLQEDMVSKMKEIEEEKKRENENVAEESSPGQNDFSLQIVELESQLWSCERHKARTLKEVSTQTDDECDRCFEFGGSALTREMNTRIDYLRRENEFLMNLYMERDRKVRDLEHKLWANKLHSANVLPGHRTGTVRHHVSINKENEPNSRAFERLTGHPGPHYLLQRRPNNGTKGMRQSPP